MKWINVRLILGREIRDQLRDRRTLFMIAVLPMLLYPLMGMAFLQVGQFLKEDPSRVFVFGAEELPEQPALLEEGQISADLYSSEDRVGLIELTLDGVGNFDPSDSSRSARELIEEGQFDAVVFFPAGFGSALDRLKASISNAMETDEKNAKNESLSVPLPSVYFNAAKDKSRIAHDRVELVLGRWRQRIVDQTLAANQLSARTVSPFDVATNDISEPAGRQAVIWSKVLPFVLLVWALTGAFYPAIDLCAGEKERGTLETLLSSPAERGEIVLGKLVTIMLFSMVTSLLNILSMGITATFIMHQLRGIGNSGEFEIGPPPAHALGWLVLALVPLSALFSALSLALATMARSTKEGQYYLMPLLLVTMPLLIVPMLPAAELNLGTSIIPVTGVVLLLRSLMEGQYAEALLFVVPVGLVTFICCMMAIQWAIDQFNNEFVLFRESERLDLGLWLRHLVRDRGDTPSVAEAIMCGLLLLFIRFFAGFLLPVPGTWQAFSLATIVNLVAFVATPALLMTIMLTRHRRKTLLIRRPPLLSLGAAVLLAFCLHPVALAGSELIRYLYPLDEATLAPIGRVLERAPSIWHVVFLLAFVPAVCEEFAFRGFILSGLRHFGSKWKAIFISSVFFGLAHGLLQQSIMATAVGMLIGYIAVQTRSIFPCILFHITHNSLAILAGEFMEQQAQRNPQLHWLILEIGERQIYIWPVFFVSLIFTGILLNWFRQLPFQPTPEERLHDALEHQSAPAAVR